MEANSSLIPAVAIHDLFWDFVTFIKQLSIFIIAIFSALKSIFIFFSDFLVFVSKIIDFIGKLSFFLRWPAKQLSKCFVFSADIFILISNLLKLAETIFVGFSNSVSLVKNIYDFLQRYILSRIALYWARCSDFGLLGRCGITFAVLLLYNSFAGRDFH